MAKIQQKELIIQRLVEQVKILEQVKLKQLVQQRELTIVNLKQKEKIGENQKGKTRELLQQKELTQEHHQEVVQILVIQEPVIVLQKIGELVVLKM